MLKKYGDVHNSGRNSSVREKCYITNEKLHGNRNWNNTEKQKSTTYKKYGVYHITHSLYFLQKILKKKWKQYKTPNGKIIKIQGDENYALDTLLKKFNENEIRTERKKMQKINYIF